MMEEELKVTAYTCDDPDCRARILMEGGEPADGFHGNVVHIGSHGGNGAKWYACRATHIRAAVEGALGRDDRA